MKSLLWWIALLAVVSVGSWYSAATTPLSDAECARAYPHATGPYTFPEKTR